LAEQPGHQHGVAGIVQLELVDGQQPVAGQPAHRLGETERADQVGVLDEGPVRLRAGHGMPERCQQVGLADAETAVQVVPARCRRCLPEESLPRRGGDPRRKRGQRVDGCPLAGFIRRRAVGVEPHRIEAWRRYQGADQLVRADDGIAVDQVDHGHEDPP
jgi:hypothetical protein